MIENKENHGNLSHECIFASGLSWQEWVILLVLVGYALLATVSLVLGSVFLDRCFFNFWESLWLIVHGRSHVHQNDTQQARHREGQAQFILDVHKSGLPLH